MRNIKISARLKIAFSSLILVVLVITVYAIIVIGQASPDSVSSIKILIALSTASVLFGIWVMFSFIGSIVKPLVYLSKLATDVSDGDLNILLSSDDKDEIGVFKNSFGKMIRTINDLTDEIEYMAVAQAEGVSSEYIVSGNYRGKYNDIAILVNDLQSKNNEITSSAINTVYEIGNGNFDSPADKFPGDKAVLNETIELLRGNLKKVHMEIMGLAFEDPEGKLANRARVSEFKGDWANLMQALNTLMETITAPINEAVIVVGKMAEGDLNVRMAGKYKGDYEKIKISVNEMTTEIGDYIKEISSVLTALSSNDFTVNINRQYVGDFSLLKDSINNIVVNLNRVMSEIRSAAEQLSNSSKQISDSSMYVAVGAKDQSDSISVLNTTISEFESIMAGNMERAKKADQLSGEVAKAAALGNDEMGNLLAAMGDIRQSSQSINNVIKVIKDIAFQTNLLALNASVEAARAGEYGKGFAVVAEEVRNLSIRSQKAAQETNDLLTSTFMKIENGAEIAENTSKALNEITQIIVSISSYIQNISGAIKTQNEKVDTMSRNMDVISKVTTENSASSQQSAATAQELSSQAQLFHGVLSKFKLT